MNVHRHLLVVGAEALCHMHVADRGEDFHIHLWFRNTDVHQNEHYRPWCEPIFRAVADTGKPWLQTWQYYSEGKTGQKNFTPNG